MILMARALLALLGSSFRRQLLSRKTLLCALLLGLLGIVVFTSNALHHWYARDFVQLLVLRAFGLFYLPIVALAYGTGALGDDREEKTLVYPPLPLPRPRPDQPGRPVSSRTCTVLPLVKFCNCAAVK